MNTQTSKVIVANITWNDSGWRNVYANPQAGHRYARNHPGHESLNFDFDKEVLGDGDRVYGFIQWIGPPRHLSEHSLAIFYSKNLKTKKGQLVGIYGDVEILKEVKTAPYAGFENNEFQSNVSARRDISLLFPIPLNADRYSGGERLVPQSGFAYKDERFAEQVISDEIQALKKSGRRIEEYATLKRIYAFITGEEYRDEEHTDDLIEQEEILVETRREHDREKEIQFINRYLTAMKPGDSETVFVSGNRYKRNNALIAKIKYLRGERCQICGLAILKKDGTPYTEAAHIKAKSDSGTETPDNLMILCPNHHKEFDLGYTEIINLTENNFRFKLNGQIHQIDLSLKRIQIKPFSLHSF